MKKIIFTLSFVLATSIAFSQANQTTPNFPDCTGNETEMKKCFQIKMQKFIAKKFNSDLPIQLALKPGSYRLELIFTVKKDGSIANMRVDAPHQKLQEEGLRILQQIPTLLPATKDGVAINTKMAFPMMIAVEDSRKNWKRYRKAQKKKDKEVKF